MDGMEVKISKRRKMNKRETPKEVIIEEKLQV